MLPWTEGMIDRSAADLVMCRLRAGEKWIPVLGNVGYCRHVINIMLYKICGNQFRVSNITVLRGATIQVGYDSIRILILLPRFNTYHNTQSQQILYKIYTFNKLFI